jgi:hypothetical protein
MKKLYPSSAAFMMGDVVVTEYDSGCLRKILLTEKGIKSPFPAIYGRLGAVHEILHEQKIRTDEQVESFLREVPIRVPITDYPNVQYSGRADFICQYVDKKEVIHETKATISKNTRLQMRKGQVKTNQLAQLVSYMIIRQTQWGKIIAGYYEENAAGELVQTEEKIYKVFIDDEGAIWVDGQPSGFTVYDQIAHRQAAAQVISEGIIGGRPDKWDDKYKGPCARCIHKDTCTAVDIGAIATPEAFVQQAKRDSETALENRKPDPVPNKLKVKKPSKKGKKNVRGNSNENS